VFIYTAGKGIDHDAIAEISKTLTRNQAATLKRCVTSLYESTRRGKGRAARPDVRNLFQVCRLSLASVSLHTFDVVIVKRIEACPKQLGLGLGRSIIIFILKQ
jgi:hypothetical protein